MDRTDETNGWEEMVRRAERMAEQEVIRRSTDAPLWGSSSVVAKRAAKDLRQDLATLLDNIHAGALDDDRKRRAMAAMITERARKDDQFRWSADGPRTPEIVDLPMAGTTTVTPAGADVTVTVVIRVEYLKPVGADGKDDGKDEVTR